MLYLAGTADTKFDELDFVRTLLHQSGHEVLLVDLSTTEHLNPVDITAQEIAGHHADGAGSVLGLDDRGAAVSAMGIAFAAFCQSRSDTISGIMGMGGGGGTSMVTAGMRCLPYGVPKVMVSTLASGDTAPFVGTSDIAMFPSVTDLVGLNSISRIILTNAASAFAGMVSAGPAARSGDNKAIGMTMFGVTTQAVTQIIDLVGNRAECLAFHATGTGGRTMEQLLREGHLQGLIDLTTTEIADELFGGVLSAGAERLDAVASTGAPYVGAPGALDMVNFWGPQTVPEHYRDHTLYYHNPNVTLMRTNADECGKLGQWIGHKLNACNGPVRFLIPEKGFSSIDKAGGPFWLPEADDAFIRALTATLAATPDRQISILPFHINDPEFAEAAVANYFEISEV